MSWALEEWKEGLPTRALQKIQELEGQLDKLKKEKQQRQFQLDSLEAALQKQKQKVDNEKTEGAHLKRENQRLMEICENLEKAKQKISHELQVKESQVNFQEGQLNSGKKQVEKLEQELKRCKSELERSQQPAQSADVSLSACGTPQKLFATPLTPSQCYAGSKYEDLKEKYNKEVEERKRLEAEVKALQAKKVSQGVPQTAMNHRDIARHQASSSVFSWQQEKTPSRLSSAQKTPVRRDVSAARLWGDEDLTPSASALQAGPRDGSCTSCEDSGNPHLLDQLKTQNQDLRSKVNELKLRLQEQEKEMKVQANKFQESQLHLEKTKVALIDKEKALNKSRDELVRTTAQSDQVASKCAVLEQKLKKVTEDLSCQRQNAESARCSLEQKIKEKEKGFQEELAHQRRSFQALDQECTQTKTRLTHELQQTKNTLSTLQAELDKITSVKQQLEKNLEELKQKFCRMEHALQSSQMAENELRRHGEELKKENGLLKSQCEQSAREVCHLEEELRKVKVCFSQSQNFVEEMKAKNTSQEVMLRDLQEKVSQQEDSLTLEKLKAALAALEKQRDCSQDLLKKREQHIQQLSGKLSNTEKELGALFSALQLKKRECEELKEEKTWFSSWKDESEKLLSQMESEKKSLQSKLSHLETCLESQQTECREYRERARALEVEKEALHVEMRNLHNVLDSKVAEIETQKTTYLELQQKAELSDQKHQKELENMCLKASQLTGHVEGLQRKLQSLSEETVAKDQRYQELHAEYESLRSLLKPKALSPFRSADHQKRSLAFEQQPVMSNSVANLIEQGSMYFSEGCVDIAQSRKNPATSQNGTIALESQSLQMNSDLQKQCEELVQTKGEIEENLTKAEQVHESFVTETNEHISQLQEDSAVHLAETLVALENKERELQYLKETLEAVQAEIQELRKKSCLLEDTLKESQLLTETLSSEKKEMSSIISLSKKEIEELTQENQTLKKIKEAMNQERLSLLQKIENISNCVEEREKTISDLSDQYKQERLLLLQRCEESGAALEDLSEKYSTAQASNARLECLLEERSRVCESRSGELQALQGTFAKEQEQFLAKLALAEEQNEKLILELDIMQQTLRDEITNIRNSSESEVGSLRQEIRTLKEEQSKMQKEVDDLVKENAQLIELTQAKHGPLPALESGKDSERGTEGEMDKHTSEHHMDLDMKDTSPGGYKAQLVHLEAVIRTLELKLDQSEKEKQNLQQELQTIRGLEPEDPQESSSFNKREVDAEDQCISVPCVLSASQSDIVNLQSSLQATVSKLAELEKMCEVLKVEKLELESELNDSRSECITATSKMAAEVEKLVNEVKILNDESGLLQSELVKEMPIGPFGGQHDTSVHLSPLDNSNFYEQMCLSDKEVQVHFAELQEKFSSLQSEHQILHDQHCQVSARMSELRSYVDTLKAENSALSTNLKNLQDDLEKERKPGPEEGLAPSLPSACVTDSPELIGVPDVLEHAGDTSVLSNSEGNIAACSSGDDVSYSSLEATLAEEDIPCTSGRSTEELEGLCRLYLQSLKSLEEQMQSQGLLRKKEMEELEQLLGSERKELDGLREQYAADREHWQQKLASVTLDMESRLAAEKQQTKHLSLELEAARLQLQGLDLSTRSLLGADLEDAIRAQNDNCDIKESEVNAPETTERTAKQDTVQMCATDVQQHLEVEAGVTDDVDAVRPAAQGCEKQSAEPSHEMLAEDGTQDFSTYSSPSSLSGPHALMPMDIPETRVSIQKFQLQKEPSSENLGLLRAIEDWDKKVESLLNEIIEIDSKFDLQDIQLKIKIETCMHLEKIVNELKKKRSDLSVILESFSCNQGLFQKVENSEDLGSNLEVGANRLLNEVVKGSAANMEENWKERFLDVEKELTRVKSEKAGIEHHTLSVEADLQMLQAEKLCLEKDNESKQNTIVGLKEELSFAISEKNRLGEEVNATAKESQALGQMLEKMKEKIEELESREGENLQRTQAAEDEVRDKAELLQTLSSHVSELTEDKAVLQERLQNLQEDRQALSVAAGELESQIVQLNEDRESLARESRDLQAKLSESEHEKLTISKALEAALTEKGEFAIRLSSTQEEVHQLRRGIEKLSVRIEADEKKQLHTVEKLKESQREKDALKDKVENLERELQMSEENQELVILDAENSKAEVETLKSQIDEMAKTLRTFELELATVRSEKENLAKQLQEKQVQVSELDGLLSSLRSLVEDKERARVQVEEDSKATVLTLQTHLKALGEEVAALCNDPEICRAQEQSLDLPGEEMHHLKSSIAKLKVHRAADEKKQRQISEQLKESQHCARLLQDRVENLERDLESSKKNHKLVILEAENSKAEIQTLKTDIQGMVQNLSDLDLQLTNTRSENESLRKELHKEQARVSELEVINSSVENLLQEKEQAKKEYEIAVEMLHAQVKELDEQVGFLRRDQEAYETKEQDLSGRVASLELEKAQLLQDLDENKNSYIALQSAVKDLFREVEEGKQKLEKRDEDFRKLEDQLQDREQLVAKLSQVEGEQQLCQKQKLELESLTVELEQKVEVLQSRNDTLQNAFEALQSSYKGLESELELVKMEKMSLVERVNTTIRKEAELQRQMQEMVQKTTELKEESSGEKHRLIAELNSMVQELKSVKVEHLKYVSQLEKEFGHAQGKIKLLLKSCKQLEGEKKTLQEELTRLEAEQKQKTGSIVDDNADELMNEIKELKETLEGKAKEADEYLDKYCSLLISHEKLAKAKEMLETQVARLSSQHPKRDLHSPPVLTASAAPGPSPAPGHSQRKSSSGHGKVSGKRQRSSGRWENSELPAPSSPDTFSKKSKKAAGGPGHPAEDDDAQFEPEGLPEVVKKGFADIPTGKMSPYVLRRTTMATRTSPRLAAQRQALSSTALGKENVAESSKPTAGGSRSQKVKVSQRSPVGSSTAFPEPPVKSLMASVPERSPAESPREGCLDASPPARPGPKDTENCRVQ